jgi:Phospholipid methyltransferase
VYCGQYLNFSVYKVLTLEGVYYGSRFKKVSTWISDFPYNIGIPDPQYVGCLLTLIGCLMFSPIEIILWWAANYFYLMCLESKVPE